MKYNPGDYVFIKVGIYCSNSVVKIISVSGRSIRVYGFRSIHVYGFRIGRQTTLSSWFEKDGPQVKKATPAQIVEAKLLGRLP